MIRLLLGYGMHLVFKKEVILGIVKKGLHFMKPFKKYFFIENYVLDSLWKEVIIWKKCCCFPTKRGIYWVRSLLPFKKSTNCYECSYWHWVKRGICPAPKCSYVLNLLPYIIQWRAMSCSEHAVFCEPRLLIVWWNSTHAQCWNLYMAWLLWWIWGTFEQKMWGIIV